MSALAEQPATEVQLPDISPEVIPAVVPEPRRGASRGSIFSWFRAKFTQRSTGGGNEGDN
jgi:hypothetical protein